MRLWECMDKHGKLVGVSQCLLAQLCVNGYVVKLVSTNSLGDFFVMVAGLLVVFLLGVVVFLAEQCCVLGLH